MVATMFPIINIPFVHVMHIPSKATKKMYYTEFLNLQIEIAINPCYDYRDYLVIDGPEHYYFNEDGMLTEYLKSDFLGFNTRLQAMFISLKKD